MGLYLGKNLKLWRAQVKAGVCLQNSRYTYLVVFMTLFLSILMNMRAQHLSETRNLMLR